jgi:hypothetical protein
MNMKRGCLGIRVFLCQTIKSHILSANRLSLETVFAELRLNKGVTRRNKGDRRISLLPRRAQSPHESTKKWTDVKFFLVLMLVLERREAHSMSHEFPGERPHQHFSRRAFLAAS